MNAGSGRADRADRDMDGGEGATFTASRMRPLWEQSPKAIRFIISAKTGSASTPRISSPFGLRSIGGDMRVVPCRAPGDTRIPSRLGQTVRDALSAIAKINSSETDRGGSRQDWRGKRAMLRFADSWLMGRPFARPPGSSVSQRRQSCVSSSAAPNERFSSPTPGAGTAARVRRGRFGGLTDGGDRRGPC